MKHIEIAEQRVVGGWLRLSSLFGWNIFFKCDCCYFQFISNEKTNEVIVLSNTKQGRNQEKMVATTSAMVGRTFFLKPQKVLQKCLNIFQAASQTN
jgi:hypothetical protein